MLKTMVFVGVLLPAACLAENSVPPVDPAWAASLLKDMRKECGTVVGGWRVDEHRVVIHCSSSNGKRIISYNVEYPRAPQVTPIDKQIR